MLQKTIIGVMGPGESATDSDIELASKIGAIIAKLGYVLLTGGRNCGVMHEALKACRENNGLSLAILPGSNTDSMSEYADIPIITGMGNARNAINILSSKVVVAIGSGAGTLSEIALAVKSKKPLIVLNQSDDIINYLNKLKYTALFPVKSFNEKAFLDMLNKLTD